jgi:3-oxoacyl-[acyl-carrier protein] reductase
LGVKSKAYQTNAGNFAACEIFVNNVLKEFGQIDICVNNAGYFKRQSFVAHDT